MADTKRIEKEMNDLLKSELVPVNKVQKINNNNLIWKVIFDGPDESPYEDGIFILKFIFPEDYPKNGPEARFITPMFHPNVDPTEDQHVCINLLNKWDSKRTLEDVILGIYDILLNPMTKNAYGNEACLSLGRDYDEYYDKVEEYTYKYAKKIYENYNSVDDFKNI
jgi:ubiquitin-protein ligase